VAERFRDHVQKTIEGFATKKECQKGGQFARLFDETTLKADQLFQSNYPVSFMKELGLLAPPTKKGTT